MTSDDDLDPAAALFAESLPPKQAVARIRAARYAGRFYPADPNERAAKVTALLGPGPATGPRITGLVVPHGPWTSVGSMIASALREGVLEENVVVLGPNHASRGPRAAIVCDGAYAFPGGVTVPIESTLSESVRALGGLAEAPEVFADEHAIEVLLPFLAAMQPRLAIVPVALHDLAPSAAARIGAALADAIVGRGGGVTIVATTDVAHYGDAEQLAAASDPIVEGTIALDDDALVTAFRARLRTQGPILETCGLGALLVFVHALRTLGARPGKIVARGNSMTTGTGVSWASLAFTS